MVTESTLRQASTSRPWIPKGYSALGTMLIRALVGLAMLTVGLTMGLTPRLTIGGSAWAEDPSAQPPLGIYIYAIARDGAPVGQQRMEFVSDGEKLRVISRMQLDVTLLGMSLYGFDQQAEEVRSGGRLIQLVSEANDDGKDKKLTLTLEGDRLKGTYNDKSRAADPQLLTSLFWQKPAIGKSEVIDSVSGKQRDVVVSDVGAETLSLPVGKIETHHFRVRGEMERELWYDAAGILVAGQRDGPDGSKIRLELQQRP
jgi:hypothetical protein